MTGDHSCEFHRPGYECPTCGVHVLEYAEGMEERAETFEARLAEVVKREQEADASWRLKVLKAEACCAVYREALESVDECGTLKGIRHHDLLVIAATKCAAAIGAPDVAAERLLKRLDAAEDVCHHVEYAFTGPTRDFMHLPGETMEMRELGVSYTAWLRAAENGIPNG